MQHSPFEIKSRLLRAVDREYNVVDMGTVLEIVTILERTPITKEALETTRLGRDINELRRKTKDESLAKRAKDLVRRWRDLILPQSEGGGSAPSQTDTSSQNGATLAPSSVIGVGARRQPGIPATSSTSGPGPGGGALRSTPISPATSLPASDKSSVSPALSTSRLDAVPRTHASNKRLRKEGDSSKSNSPELPPNKKSKSEELPPIQEINNQSTAVARLNGDHYDDSVGSDCEIVSVTPATPSTPTKQKSRKKAPKDRTKKKKDGGGSKSGGGDIVKEKIASIARLHKVKTTQELLAGLQSKSGDNCVFPSEDVALNKSEHIVKFLRSQTENDEDIVVDVEGRSDQEEDDAKKLKTGNSVSKTNKIAVKREKGADKSKSSNQQGSTLAPSKSTVLQTPEEILSRLPPLDLDAIDWSDDVVLPDETTVPPSKAAAVTEADVDRVLQEHVPGVNGNFEEVEPGGERIFREWHELFTTMSNDQPLHILPYVVID